MELKTTSPRRPPNRLLDHLLLWGVSAATLVLFGTSGDFYRGKADVGDAILLTAAFLTTGYFVSWSTWIWRRTDGTRVEGFVAPCFMVVVMAYFVLAGRAAFIQPTATATAVLGQVLSLVVICARD